jgi:hypothetical protein
VSRDPLRELLAQFRELASKMALTTKPTLLTYREAAQRLALKPTQFKARYVNTKRIRVYHEDGMRPRVPSNEVDRIISELAYANSGSRVRTSAKRSRPVSGNAGEAASEVAKLKAMRAKRRKTRAH